MRADLRRFFELYRDAFNRLDPEAIARLFSVPSMITSPLGSVVWNEAGQIHANMVALCERYRSHGFAAAEFAARDLIEQPPDHAVVDLEWTIHRSGGRPSRSFRTGYNLRREPQGWRIVLCTAYEEDLLAD
jgi:hypothetical protein